MIDVSSLIRKIRFKVKDFDEVKYTDYEIIEQINECVEMLNMSYALQNADFLERRSELTLNDDGVFNMPNDLISLISINNSCGHPLHPVSVKKKLEWDEYYILDDKIYAKAENITVFYRRRIDEISSTNSNVDLPKMFLNVIAGGVAAMLVGENASEVISSLEDQIKDIVPRRRYANARIPMPF